MNGRIILTCLFLAGFGPFVCNDTDVEDARKHLVKTEAEAALKVLVDVDEDAAQVHLARAVAHVQQKKHDDATIDLDQAYRLVANAKARGEALPDDAELRARIAFNRGLIHAEKEEWDLAMTEFGKVLRHDPTDEDARWNLEMAWYGANPPCPLREDDHEPDDVRAQAGAYDPEKSTERLLCPTNEDWYAIDAQAHTILSVTLEAKVDTTDEKTREVTLALYGPDDPDEEPTRSAPIVDGKAVLTHSNLPADGRWTVRVAGTGDAEVTYALTVTIVPPCPVDDDFEENDTRETAKPAVEKEPQQLKACPGDPDWYSVAVPKDEGRKITVAFDAQRAPLAVALFGADGAPKAVGKIGPGGTALSVPKSDAEQQVFVRVAAEEGVENVYVLKVEPDGDGSDDKQDQDKQDQQDKQDPKDDEKQPPEKPPEPDQMNMDRLIESLDKHDRNPQLEKALRQLKVVPRMEDY